MSLTANIEFDAMEAQRMSWKRQKVGRAGKGNGDGDGDGDGGADLERSWVKWAEFAGRATGKEEESVTSPREGRLVPNQQDEHGRVRAQRSRNQPESSSTGFIVSLAPMQIVTLLLNADPVKL
jgi:hypothetical protein